LTFTHDICKRIGSMDTITFRTKPFLGVARGFFSYLHDVSSGYRESVAVADLLNALPLIQFESQSHRQDLEDRGQITRVAAQSLLVDDGALFDTEVGFIQSTFPPPPGHDELIRVRIPQELKVQYGGVGSDTF